MMKLLTKITAVTVAAGFLAACGTADVANMSVKGGDFNEGAARRLRKTRELRI